VVGQYPKVNEERKRKKGKKAKRSRKIAELLLLY
jgi:ribosomal protein S21